jgi:alpha-beta hydrolase superfamily lysophospholipase
VTRLLRIGAATVGACVLAFGALNVVAYRQAWAFTHFERSGPRTPPPQQLTLLAKARVLVAGARVPRPRNRRTPADFKLPFERHVYPGWDDIPLEAWRIPASPSRGTVVLFHGHADCKASLLAPARALRELGWTTFLVDFHGSGGSGGNDTSIGFHEATDVVRSLDYVAGLADHGPIVLFGTSMGAAAVLHAARLFSTQPAGIVLECPFDRFSRTVERRFEQMGVPRFPAEPLLLFWGGRVEGFDPLAFNPVDDAADVRVPTLLLHGDRDAFITVEEARSIVARLGGPSTLHVLQGVGHESFVIARPDEWRETLRTFLDPLS